ncbi:hypothetical protein GCM10010156_57380 [Planobispora rosea]|uniref:Uncharacterized protein n=1 Tax=Planobispora rosea TaxID=35762 RepID=A0A8J3S201_PLARO|nr:hypothetical protein [Planobispora rosea]GGS91625.1 hypothetical protein GCM10010156_57380 [Planobispora rosea]GIH87041.1 hypothetical protein Pro02_54490 [Planobispora rosea]
MTARPMAEFRVIERASGTWEARFAGMPSDVSPDASAEARGDLQAGCVTERIPQTSDEGFARAEQGNAA